MELLVGIGILVLILLAVVGAPLLLLAGLAVVLLNLILLPFKIAGCLLRAGVGVAGFSLKLLMGILGLAFAVLFLSAMIPLIPILLVGLGIYLVLRPSWAAVRPSV